MRYEAFHPLMPASMIRLPPPLSLKTPGVMSATELATWATIGKNAVPELVARFRIRELSGRAKCHRFSIHDVFRKVLGVTSEDPDELVRLLIPLQKSSWVAQMIGSSVSAISASVCEKRGALPFPIELTVTGQGQAPARGRRWIPAQIEAHLRGDPIPYLASQTLAQNAPSQRSQDHPRNVFADICGANAEVSRQL